MMYINPLNDLISSATTIHQSSLLGTLNQSQTKLFQPQQQQQQIHSYAPKYTTAYSSFSTSKNLTQHQEVRSASTCSSLSTASSSSSSTSPTGASTSNTTNAINSQLYAKNLSIINNLYPTYTTTGFAYYPNPSFAFSNQATGTSRLLATSNSISDKFLNSSANASPLYILKSQVPKSTPLFDPTPASAANTQTPTASSITYLPTTATTNPEFYFTDQSNTTTIPASYLAPTYTTDLTAAFGAKAPFATLSALNGLNALNNTRFKKHKKRFKKPIEFRKVLPKNSLMLLHELRPNVEYRFVNQSGPIHRPVFTMCVDISEHKFEGSGKTKKLARMQAAEKAIEFLMQHPEYIQKQKKQSNDSQKSADTNEEQISSDCLVNQNQDEDSNDSDDQDTTLSDSEDPQAKRFKPEANSN